MIVIAARTVRIWLAIAYPVTTLAACGGGSPTGPEDNGNPPGNNSGNVAVGPLGCAKGLMTRTIASVPFTGGVPTGASTYAPVAAVPALGLPALAF